ncbi:protein FAR1-RELATED SEQUENCE 6-like isoform X1 [Phragmites australis]|uniref:protein FAR1-RELATED SEQUENCE 6-like isoform X1 n=1 Tax=Phragmites australis TaxID=29695 RepID=UPI002D796473|nr:protein FAR1-RELATED SEQUENCE 6-like isoform X1 [Phragmites australis]
MEEEEYSTELSNEEDVQEDGEKEGNAAESDVFNPVDIDPAFLPKVGMIFDSEEDAFQFYVAYGCHAGFGITRRSNNTFDGFRYRSTFICSKGGQSRLRSGVTRPARKRGTKTGCKAKMIVKDAHFQNRWEVIVLELEHNHPLDPSLLKFKRHLKNSPFSQNPPRMSESEAPQSSSTAALSIVGDSGITSSTQIEFKTKIDRNRKLKLAEGDLEALLGFFNKMQDQNPCFFYSLDMNEQGQLRNVFWADAKSRSSYNYFGDVVAVNVTNFSDQYDMQFVSFVGTNHHAQPVLLGCGLLAGRSLGAYVWLFDTWLRCMNAKQPHSIITNYCHDVAIAIRKVFPNARHRFCLWHILNELREKLEELEKKDEVISTFSTLAYDSVTMPHFDKEWQEMIHQFHLEGNEWLSKLYEVRTQWAPVYVKDSFWAGMSVTDRSDSATDYFDGWLTSGTSLKMFVEQYEEAVKSKLEKESYEDLRSSQMRPPMMTGLPVEEQAAKVYTTEIFQKFLNEIGHSFHCNYTILDRNDSVVTYIVSEHVNQTDKVDYKVVYDNVEDDIWCLCRLFQCKGILCRHALTVLRQELVLMIPPKYIIHRWCKDCKQTCASISHPVSADNQELGSYDDLYKLGHQYLAEVVEFGSMNLESKEYALSIMREIRDKVISYEKSLRDQRVDSHVSTANFAYNPVNEDFTDDVLPISLSTKGWDLTQSQSKRSRKKKLATPTVLDTLKKKTKRAYNKRRNANANTLNTAVTATDSVTDGTNVQQNPVNEGWPLTSTGAPENFPYGVETISFDLSQYNNAPNFHWPESSSRSQLQ